jgi:hypothetical protein
MGNPMGQTPLQLASALVSASERVSFVPEVIAGLVEGVTVYSGPAMNAGGVVVPPLAPHAVIQIGNQTRIVRAAIRR